MPPAEGEYVEVVIRGAVYAILDRLISHGEVWSDPGDALLSVAFERLEEAGLVRRGGESFGFVRYVFNR